MKKIVVFCVVFICVGFSQLNAQYNLSLLHSASGKKWVQVSNPDDNQGTPADMDDSFTFFSDGRVTADFGSIRSAGDVNPSFSGGGSNQPSKNTWTSSGTVIRWSVVSGSTLRTYRAEIQVLTPDRFIVTLTEPGKEEGRSVLFVSNQ